MKTAERIELSHLRPVRSPPLPPAKQSARRPWNCEADRPTPPQDTVFNNLRPAHRTPNHGFTFRTPWKTSQNRRLGGV